MVKSYSQLWCFFYIEMFVAKIIVINLHPVDLTGSTYLILQNTYQKG